MKLFISKMSVSVEFYSFLTAIWCESDRFYGKLHNLKFPNLVRQIYKFSCLNFYFSTDKGIQIKPFG